MHSHLSAPAPACLTTQPEFISILEDVLGSGSCENHDFHYKDTQEQCDLCDFSIKINYYHTGIVRIKLNWSFRDKNHPVKDQILPQRLFSPVGNRGSPYC